MGKTMKEILEELEKKKQWKIEHPFKAFPRNAYEFIRYVLPRNINNIRYEIRYGFQRMFRGFDGPDWWGYCHANAERQIKILKHLQEHKHGASWTSDPDNVLSFPDTGSDDADVDGNLFKRWDEAIQIMIEGFEAFVEAEETHICDEHGVYDHKATIKKQEELYEKFEKGMKLYVANYRGLWD